MMWKYSTNLWSIPSSQLSPVQPPEQIHEYSLMPSSHTPPFTQGRETQSSMSEGRKITTYNYFSFSTSTVKRPTCMKFMTTSHKHFKGSVEFTAANMLTYFYGYNANMGLRSFQGTYDCYPTILEQRTRINHHYVKITLTIF